MKNLILFLLNLRFYFLRNQTYKSIISIDNSLFRGLFYGFSRRRFCHFTVYILMLLGGFQVSFAQTASFSYTGSNQTFTVQAGVISLEVTLNGVQGGNSGRPCCVGIGGLGSRTTATIAVTPSQVFEAFSYKNKWRNC